MQFLTFNIDAEIFAIPLNRVREVLEITPLTQVPNLPLEYIGIINLRDNAVTVIDLRRKLGIPEIEKTVNTAIIILEVSGRTLGVLVDAVSEVIDITESEIESPMQLSAHSHTDFLAGIGHHDKHFVLILAVDVMFAIKEKNEAGA